MNRRNFIQSAGLAVLAACGRLAAVASAEDREPKDLSDQLEGIRKEDQLPGLAAAVVRGDQIVAQGVAGVRQVDTDDKITLEDRFPIGSCTKRMTAVMIGRVIDSEKLSFETTLVEALPDIPMRDDYRKVTIAQLLTFTGGIQPYTQVGPKLTPILFELKGSAAEQQEQFVKHVLQEEPVVKPGTERKYSNASYVVAVFAASRKTGRGWEALMEEEVFEPLRLTKAGFGRPRSKERPNEPWLHRKGEKGYEPEPKEPQAEPAAVLAGAGGVHCSIRDFARFASYELSAARGKDALRKPATARRWQELSQGETSEGRPVFGGTPWLTAGYVLWPSKNVAAAVAVNGGSAADACKAVFKAVEDRHGGSDK
jgi:CubicO group peptidase (beta-lactamase class C family)